jgi:hypothetical protein
VEVEDESWDVLDAYERVEQGLYERLEVPVLVEGKEVPVQMYVAGPLLLKEIANGKYEEIQTGDWFKR